MFWWHVLSGSKTSVTGLPNDTTCSSTATKQGQKLGWWTVVFLFVSSFLYMDKIAGYIRWFQKKSPYMPIKLYDPKLLCNNLRKNNFETTAYRSTNCFIMTDPEKIKMELHGCKRCRTASTSTGRILSSALVASDVTSQSGNALRQKDIHLSLSPGECPRFRSLGVPQCPRNVPLEPCGLAKGTGRQLAQNVEELEREESPEPPTRPGLQAWKRATTLEKQNKLASFGSA